MPIKGILVLALVAILFCSVEQNHFSNFCRGSFKVHFYEIILKLGHWPTSRCRYQGFFFYF